VESEDSTLIGSEAKIALMLAEEEKIRNIQKFGRMLNSKASILGSKVAGDISLMKFFVTSTKLAYSRTMRWCVERSEEEYNHILQDQIYPALEKLKLKIKNEKLLEPKVVYGYFPCQSMGTVLLSIIYQKKSKSEIGNPKSLKNGFDFRSRARKMTVSCVSVITSLRWTRQN